MARQAVHNFMPLSSPSMSQATDAELSDALDAMYQQSSMSFPNPVHEEIKQRGKPFLESEDVLCILQGEVGRDAAQFEQCVLAKLEKAGTIKTLRMEPVIDIDDESVFDFAGFSELVKSFLTNLQSISITHMRIRNFDLRHVATIKSIELTDPQMQDRIWNLELPNLRSLVMQNHTPPVSAFAQSLIQCPKIENYFSHKYWNDEDMPKLYLPNCKSFTWRRGDCTEKLSLYVPKLEDLNLDACYDLKQLTLLKQGHASHAEWNLPRGVSHSQFNFSCQNANLGKKVKNYLIESGRVKNPIQEEDDEDMGVDAFQRHMHKCMEGVPKSNGIAGLLKGIQAASSGWHDKLKQDGVFDEGGLWSMNGEEEEEEEEEAEEEDDYEDSDDDGPTARNPWGRDGDALRGGPDAFQKIVNRMIDLQGYSFLDACAARDEDGFNAVHHCAFQGYDETLDVILGKVGVGLPGLLQAPVITGEAPLHLAVQYKREKCIELLLKAGSDVKAKDKYGKTVLDYVTRPAESPVCYQIGLDLAFQKRMQVRLKQAELSRTAASLYTIEGLTSEAGRHMNGRTCQFISIDKGTGRYIVRLNAEDPQPAWKKLKPENLKALPVSTDTQ